MNAPLLPPVSVNGVEIPAAAIAAEAQNHPAPPGKPGLAWRAAARALALREACLQAARAEGVKATAMEAAPGQWETEDEALIRAFLEARIAPVEPDEHSLRAAYDAAPDRFRAPDLWEAAHILIPAQPGTPGTEAKALALSTALATELAQAPKRFPDFAARHSACSTAKSGGLLGQIGPGDTAPEFEAALVGLNPGQVTQTPVRTRFGFHIIRLDAHARGEILPYATVRPRLADAARKVAWAQAARALAQDLMQRAEIRGLTPSDAR
ncbi:MAG: peptidylprolyl isomerase [Tabrizicola sp.]|uniref:peptidylprolyl isomerase n=1 Tax=Tabrizicola sp. TaxID=2005166 RepID=UPI0027360232|nr:peptidylprolyl isomerase [Tabrizicola sp.]MDP3264193.1 peptidylprolyl isomerase [Tabrizicola sp.]